jgi:pullulanase
MLHLYKEGLGGEAYESHLMEPQEQGVYMFEIRGDLNGVFYTYATRVNGLSQEAVDPYARAVGANGRRGMVIDLAQTNPEGWETHNKPAFDNFTDAIIYELHVRDMSVSPNSGIENKGKFLGLIEEGTTNEEGLATGIDHLKELGITHLHLLPVFDFRTIDETTLEKNDFNWGYDPENYNVPEGSYATNPYEGDVRIREFKEMVKGLHENGIRVVMDVVYNHTGASQDSSLNKLVPDYYYRTVNGVFSNGSACGNETASERSMVRKLFVDSVVYWAREYQIDGFRFDLMGLHDIETMNAIRVALNEVDPAILIYGEGWTGGASPLPQAKAALKKNTYMLPGIAAFSDDLRDGVKGHVFTDEQPGFVSGFEGMEESVKFGIVGATKHAQISYDKVNYSTSPWANDPSQSINYVAAHDNMTLWDKLAVTNPDDTEEDRKKMSMMADAIVLTSQGIPFIHAGSEFLRTKGGDENSYKSPDSVNQLDWSLKTENLDVYKYYQGLIALRKAHPSLRMQTNVEIQENLAFFGDGDEFGNLQLAHKNMIGYIITNNANEDDAATLMTFFNANKEAKEVEIPEGTWQVLVKGDRAGTDVIETITSNKLVVEPLSTMVLISDSIIPLQALAASENDVEALEETDKETTDEVEEVKTSTNRGLVGILLTIVALLIGGVAIVFGFKKFKK